jgi:alkanesulfonate monooxygenase SsuD/methylene tetrahydromethanopterin reductase-like flavin-dependent oxidoreductase (luciferase family)
MPRSPRPPLSGGSVSLRIYPHNDLPADELVSELRAQAALAVEAGFDGVMTSEHHNGFAGYLPNPLQAAGWLLEAMPHGWAAPCPLLLPLRPPALVAEEAAWLAARFPGRVGIGVAAGSLQDDFDIMGLTKDRLARRFADGLALVADALSGRNAGRLGRDPAVARCAGSPVAVVSAAMSVAAVRRAAGLGVGLLFDSLSSPARCRELVDTYREAGGAAPVTLIRRVWIGSAPIERQQRQLDVYRGYAAQAAQAHWQGEQLLAGAADAVAQQLVAVLRQAGADAVNLRIHVPGTTPAEARGQIADLADVVGALHAAIG